MTSDLVPLDLVAGRQRDQLLPEVAVLHRLLLRVLPAVLLPPQVPLVAEAIHEVRAVAVEVDAPSALERGQALDGGAKLHPLVGRQRFAADHFALAALIDHDRRPAPRAGIAGARAVRVDRDGRGCVAHGATARARAGSRARGAAQNVPR